MSSPPAQTPKAPKPPKPAKAPQPSTADAPKAKSAKELKKEKRAAAVAARGGSEGGAAAVDHGARSTAPGVADGVPAVAGSLSRKAPAAPGALSALPPVPGPSAPRRPPIAASEGSTFTPSHSTLFFSHLPEHRPPHTPTAFATAKLHPLIVRLGVLMSSGELRGANARTMAMMVAFREVIREYECPDEAVLWKDLPVYLSPMIAWLETCRPKGVGGGNAIRWLKSEINKLGEQEELSEAEVGGSSIMRLSLRLSKFDHADSIRRSKKTTSSRRSTSTSAIVSNSPIRSLQTTQRRRSSLETWWWCTRGERGARRAAAQIYFQAVLTVPFQIIRRREGVAPGVAGYAVAGPVGLFRSDCRRLATTSRG